MPLTNMWCAHTKPLTEDDAHKPADGPLVGEQRLAGEVREDLQRHAEAGQHEDVHGGVGVEPEDVLVKQRVAAGGRIEERGAGDAVQRHHQHGRGEHLREGQRDAGRGERSTTRRSACASSVMPGARMKTIVTRKFRPPRMDERPKVMIARLKKIWPWALVVLSGG